MPPKKQLTVQQLSALGHKVRWSNATDEEKKMATAKASAARKFKAKARRINSGGWKERAGDEKEGA